MIVKEKLLFGPSLKPTKVRLTVNRFATQIILQWPVMEML